MSLTCSLASGAFPSALNGLECEPLPFASGTNSAAQFLPNTGPESIAMTTLDLFPELAESTLCVEDSPASRGQAPGSSLARKMTATSGLRCLKLSRQNGPIGLLERMLLESSGWASIKCYLTWKESATPAGRLIFRLVPSEPITSGEGSGSWLPTPTAHNAKEGAYPAEYTRNTPTLATHAGGKINPRWTELLMGFPDNWTDLGPSETP